MKNRILIPALVAGLALPAVAFTHQFDTKALRQEGPSRLLTRSVTDVRKSKALVPDGMKRTVYGYGELNTWFDSHGTMECILSEDFSLLTSGSEETPDMDTPLGYIENIDPEYQYMWNSFRTEYTQEPGWGIGGSAQPASSASLAIPGTCGMAGGQICFSLGEGEIDLYIPPTEAMICTPLLDFTGGSNMGVIEFRVKSKGEFKGYGVQVGCAETNDFAPTWRYPDDACMIGADLISQEWETYRVLFRDLGPTSILQIVGIGPGTLFVDDVKVYKFEPKTATPQVLPHSNYQGREFRANWSAVDCDKYIFTLFEEEETTNEYGYTITNQVKVPEYDAVEVPGSQNYIDLTDLNDGDTYYYEVYAIKDGIESVVSFRQTVFDLTVPVITETTMTGPWSYNSKWTYGVGSDVFHYRGFAERVIKENGPYLVTDLKFDGLLYDDETVPPYGIEGEDETGWVDVYDDYYSRQIHQAWRGKNGGPVQGAMAIAGFYYYYQNSDAGLISSAMDMSKDGGKFSVTVNLCVSPGWTGYTDDGTAVFVQTMPAVAVFTWDDEKGDYTQRDLQYWPSDDVPLDWSTRTFEFDCGTDNTIIGIYAVNGDKYVFIKELQVEQEYMAGETFMDPWLFLNRYGWREYEKQGEIDVEVPSWASGCDLYHQICAFGRKPDASGYGYIDRTSEYTPLAKVGTTEYTSVKQVALENGSVTRNGSTLSISNPAGEAVTVASVNGALLYSGTASVATLELPARGLYIVRIGTHAAKLLY